MKVEKIFQMEAEIKGKNVTLEELKKENTAVIFVDMVKGFVYEGALASERIIKIEKTLVELNEKTYGYKKIFFLDEHEKGCSEHDSYAEHCIKGSSEAELVESLKEGATLHSNTTMIPKNSTNGFHAPLFKKWLEKNEASIENYIIVGCEADICVSHFATTLKTYFNEKNLRRRIIVPSNAVETFDFGTHDGDLIKVISLWEMKSNGIEVVDEII